MVTHRNTYPSVSERFNAKNNDYREVRNLNAYRENREKQKLERVPTSEVKHQLELIKSFPVPPIEKLSPEQVKEAKTRYNNWFGGKN